MWSIDAWKMGPWPIGSFAASGTTLDATVTQCVQYSIKSIESSFQVTTLVAMLPLGVFIPLHKFLCTSVFVVFCHSSAYCDCLEVTPGKPLMVWANRNSNATPNKIFGIVYTWSIQSCHYWRVFLMLFWYGAPFFWGKNRGMPSCLTCLTNIS